MLQDQKGNHLPSIAVKLAVTMALRAKLNSGNDSSPHPLILYESGPDVWVAYPRISAVNTSEVLREVGESRL